MAAEDATYCRIEDATAMTLLLYIQRAAYDAVEAAAS